MVDSTLEPQAASVPISQRSMKGRTSRRRTKRSRVCVYVCVSVCVCVSVFRCGCAHACVDVDVRVCMCKCKFKCMSKCMCMCKCKCVCMCVYVCMCVCVESLDRMTSSLIQASCEWFWTQWNVPRIPKRPSSCSPMYFFDFGNVTNVWIPPGPQ